MNEFVEHLSSIIGHCEYEGEIDIPACSLLTAFIVGLLDQRVRVKLVLEKGLTLGSAIRIAESYLTVEAESRQLHNKGPVHKVAVVAVATPEHRRCHRCGNTNHSQDACRF